VVLEYFKVRLPSWTSAGETDKNHEVFNESWYFYRHSDVVLYECKSKVLPLQPTYSLLRHTCRWRWYDDDDAL